MGIDVYLSWAGQTEAEHGAQLTGWSVTAGNVGYLREAYRGGPYVTPVLCREAAESDEGEAAISAVTLRARLPTAVMLALVRYQLIYGNGTDQPGRMGSVAELPMFLKCALNDIVANRAAPEPKFDPAALSEITEMIEARALPDFALAFVDFVTLAERMEAATGEPCTVIYSG